MYENVKKYGMENQSALYKTPGKMVIAQYPNGKEAMLSEIYNQGTTKISKHCADPLKLNVFDIAPSSVSNKQQFHSVLLNDARINKLLSPLNSNDKAFHIEIPQIPIPMYKCILY